MELVTKYGFELTLISRMFMACLSGFLIGLEREKRHKFAGIRTHIIVALGACLGVILSKYSFNDVGGNDTSRVAAQIISGIGFLGTGVIFVKGDKITGLTTAAGIWTTAIIAMGYGAGMYLYPIIATIIVFITQKVFDKFDIANTKIKEIITINSTNRDIWLEIEKYIFRQNLKYKPIYRTYTGDTIEFSFAYYSKNEDEFNEFILYISSFKNINKVEIKHVEF